jgi:hypothetical protein
VHPSVHPDGCIIVARVTRVKRKIPPKTQNLIVSPSRRRSLIVYRLAEGAGSVLVVSPLIVYRPAEGAYRLAEGAGSGWKPLPVN